jgi:hypothetical protein
LKLPFESGVKQVPEMTVWLAGMAGAVLFEIVDFGFEEG